MNTEQDSAFRAIKTFVLRTGRMTDAQQQNYTDLSGRWCIPFADIFENTNPVVIEIGFGMGAATAVIAQQNPQINYIGIEVHRPGVGRLLGEIERNNLSNLFIIEHDALEVLEYMIPDNSVSGFHIFFPDPWPKKRHHKRRLLQRPRTDLIARKLEKDGYIYAVTDWEPYAEFALEQLTQTPLLENRYSGFAEKQEWRPETKFERKGLQAERVIREMYFIRKDAE